MPAEPPAAPVPSGAVDSHVHLFGPNHRYPFALERSYTPAQEAGEEALLGMLRRLGLERAVLVQPSVYGADHRRLEQGLWRLGAAARGVAARIEWLSAQDLRRLDAMGVRGARFNAPEAVAGDALLQALRVQARRVAELGWRLQAHLRGPGLLAALALAPELPCELVVDHFGYCPGDDPAASDIGRALLAGLEGGRLWMKLSGAYRLGEDGRERAALLTERLLAVNPERLVWGSDWPHTPSRDQITSRAPRPFQPVDAAALLADFLAAAPRAEHREQVLARNPRALYGFDTS